MSKRVVGGDQSSGSNVAVVRKSLPSSVTALSHVDTQCTTLPSSRNRVTGRTARFLPRTNTSMA